MGQTFFSKFRRVDCRKVKKSCCKPSSACTVHTVQCSNMCCAAVVYPLPGSSRNSFTMCDYEVYCTVSAIVDCAVTWVTTLSVLQWAVEGIATLSNIYIFFILRVLRGRKKGAFIYQTRMLDPTILSLALVAWNKKQILCCPPPHPTKEQMKIDDICLSLLKGQ